MYNLLISIGVALVLLVLGWAVAGSAIAGIIPALIGLLVTYFVLARKTGQQLQAIMMEAMKEFEALQSMQPPRTPSEAQRMRELQLEKIKRGKEIMQRGFALSKHQFLVKEQIHAQLGAIEYMQMNWAGARAELEKAWGRNWQAMGMLACIDHREKKHAEALARMEKLKLTGGREPLYWGLYTWLAAKGGQPELALKVANEGKTKVGGSPALAAMADALANKKPLSVDGFAPQWYQFFPEHAPQMQEAQRQAAANRPPNMRPGGYTFPHPRR